MKTLSVLLAAVALSGCATVVDGRYQNIELSSNAPGATCGITQNGVQVVEPTPVPATHTVRRRSGALIVSCEAPGHQPATKALVAGRNPLAVTGHLAGILLGAGADAAFGGLAEYQEQAYIHLVKG